MGSETKAFICLATILPGLGSGRNGDLEDVAMRFVSVFSAQSLLHTMLWGRAWMKMWGTVRRRMKTCRESKISLNGT